MALFASACNKHKNVPKYELGKITKSDTADQVDVWIDTRMTATELVAIAGKIKSDSDKLKNLKFIYLLPGNAEITTGPNSFYATLRYLNTATITAADTLKDSEGDAVRLKIFGLNENKAQQLFGVTHQELAGQKLVGKFIDDYNHTVIIPFYDHAANNELKIIELDSSGNVASATIPEVVNEKGVIKWKVTEHGDYMLYKDSVLSQYAIDGFGVPFNSIKANE